MIDFRQDITHRVDEELSMLVMNDPYFYAERANRPFLMALIDEQYIYTKQQMESLEQTLEADASEK